MVRAAGVVAESQNTVGEQKKAVAELSKLSWISELASTIRRQPHWTVKDFIGSWPAQSIELIAPALERLDAALFQATDVGCPIAVVNPIKAPAKLARVPTPLEAPKFHVGPSSSRRWKVVAVAAPIFLIVLAGLAHRSGGSASSQPSPHQVTQPESSSAPVTPIVDDQSAIISALSREGYLLDGSIVDTEGIAGGPKLHVVRTSCSSTANGCVPRLFVFAGKAAVWSEELSLTPFNSPVASTGPAIFSIGMMERSADGQETPVVATYTWDGDALTKHEQLDADWNCGNQVCDPNSSPAEGTLPQPEDSSLRQASTGVQSEPPATKTAEVRAALQDWITAMRTNDPDRISACYADPVDRYFLQQNWNRNAIRTYLTRWFHGGEKRIVAFDVSIVDLQLDPNNVFIAKIVKTMDILDSSGDRHLVARSELRFVQNVNGMWYIASERDFK